MHFVKRFNGTAFQDTYTLFRLAQTRILQLRRKALMFSYAKEAVLKFDQVSFELRSVSENIFRFTGFNLSLFIFEGPHFFLILLKSHFCCVPNSDLLGLYLKKKKFLFCQHFKIFRTANIKGSSFSLRKQIFFFLLKDVQALGNKYSW